MNGKLSYRKITVLSQIRNTKVHADNLREYEPFLVSIYYQSNFNALYQLTTQFYIFTVYNNFQTLSTTQLRSEQV
jgi:hypothetical protein